MGGWKVSVLPFSVRQERLHMLLAYRNQTKNGVRFVEADECRGRGAIG